MKKVVAALMVMLPFVGAACMAGAGGVGGGCGMGGHAGHGAGTNESHAHGVKDAGDPRPTVDPNFDAARTRGVLEAYDRIVVALSGDKTSGVTEAAANIARSAPNATVKEAAGALSAVDQKSDIADMRERFKTLSNAIVLYVAGNHESLAAALENEKLPMPRQAYCPMADATWLQPGEKITNPFYGSGMLRCGEFQDWAEGN